MKFQMPQFIEVESKIFGSFTFKQFIYLAGGGGMGFVIYSIFPFFIAALLIVPLAALVFALAFYKVNNRNFIDVMESFFKYTINSKLYIWKKEKKKIKPQEEQEEESSTAFVPRLSESKLKDISRSLDVQDTPPDDKVIEEDIALPL